QHHRQHQQPAQPAAQPAPAAHARPLRSYTWPCAPMYDIPWSRLDVAAIIATPASRVRNETMSQAPSDSDRLDRFLLPHAGVRGVRVHLRDTWAQIRVRVDELPIEAATLLGEAAAASALFTAHIMVAGRHTVCQRCCVELRCL